MDDITFARLTSHLTKVLGLDLTAYKQQQMRRRVGTFLGKHNIANADELIRRLEADKDLLQALRDMLTINVTEFFRDGAQWELLEKQVMPHLLANKSSLKIWSAGCSRGQEPISLAITLDRLGALRGSRILGTDFDHASLAKARAGGPYASFEMGGITPDDRGRYFNEGPQGFTAKPNVLASSRFAELNLLRDRFDTGFDLIACRNVMIYFEGQVKTDLVRRFQQSLRPGGVLFIGATEALLGADLEGFDRMGGNFYRRNTEAMRLSA
ncbi:MAG: protein-glutamate O-methyltransferase CheR [Dehalococcoidia bacterium]|nr:protein-glutamate O-methyltransferase CheR [Dehalococcoidia bacterium]MCB9484420.1 protein-glutamate O-methyltransferase CheR [Dehalococcoidia bacterium]MCB9490814.1 protein-glutamate O-methyltransferase CheR [Dehalococcoidia bacterium]